jgi:hypothetical protein
MMLVAASIFMLFFSLNLPTVFIDNFLFQLSFVFIHIYLSIPLFKELIPPTFSDEEKKLFKSHFKKYFTPSEFKHLLSGVRRRVFKVSSSIVQRGNGFSSIFFIAKKPKENPCLIELKSGKKMITNLEEYSWIGIMEYISFIKDTGSLKKALESNDSGVWGVDCLITFGSQSGQMQRTRDDKEFTQEFDDSIEEEVEDNHYLKNKNELIVYEWDLEVFS